MPLNKRSKTKTKAVEIGKELTKKLEKVIDAITPSKPRGGKPQKRSVASTATEKPAAGKAGVKAGKTSTEKSAGAAGKGTASKKTTAKKAAPKKAIASKVAAKKPKAKKAVTKKAAV